MEQRHIGPTVRRLNNLIKRETDKSSVKQHIDNLTGLHGWVIRYIREQEGAVFQRDLEKRFSCRRSTMSNVLSLMEKNGLIERRVSKEDARLKEIVLTEAAHKVHEMAKADMMRLDAIFAAGIEEEELEVFFRVADKIRANIERQEQND
jgi:DNA-binding MarR family transcriptional regulator